MRSIRTLTLFAALWTMLLAHPPEVVAAPAGQMTWAVHISLAPTFFDPGTSSGGRTISRGKTL